MKDTSLEAYRKIAEDGTAETQRERVFSVLFNQGTDLTRAELARASGVRINAVCGRVNEMLRRSVVEELPRRACRITGFSAHPVRVPQ